MEGEVNRMMGGEERRGCTAEGAKTAHKLSGKGQKYSAVICSVCALRLFCIDKYIHYPGSVTTVTVEAAMKKRPM